MSLPLHPPVSHRLSRFASLANELPVYSEGNCYLLARASVSAEEHIREGSATKGRNTMEVDGHLRIEVSRRQALAAGASAILAAAGVSASAFAQKPGAINPHAVA